MQANGILNSNANTNNNNASANNANASANDVEITGDVCLFIFRRTRARLRVSPILPSSNFMLKLMNVEKKNVNVNFFYTWLCALWHNIFTSGACILTASWGHEYRMHVLASEMCVVSVIVSFPASMDYNAFQAGMNVHNFPHPSTYPTIPRKSTYQILPAHVRCFAIF